MSKAVIKVLHRLVVFRTYNPPVEGETFRFGHGNVATEKLREAYTELILMHNDARTEHAGTWFQMNLRVSKAVDKLRNWRKTKISSVVLGCVDLVYFIAKIILDIKVTKIVKLALEGEGRGRRSNGLMRECKLLIYMLFGTLFLTTYPRVLVLIEG